ncbi:fumarylacetoacetate hydrolase family protein [Rhodococcus sp. NPDC056960]|uniref:fumarylacetoacetate hydrolase family protein n=1 Tax=Rhodococcus sp. NPDC056960 TaxID=3345982 RepID=UPI00364109A7
MKFATIAHQSRHLLTRQDDQFWHTAPGATMLDLISDATSIDFDGPVISGDQATVVLPYRPPTIFGIGLNYHDTVREMNWDIPAVPYLFPKLSSSVTGPADPIEIDETVTTRADWEGELAVVIGAPCRNVAPEDALDAVFGYTAANDVSARDLQAADGQWVRGKGLDTFCPLGPVVVTADEIEDPQDVRIRTRLNDRTVQDGTTADMIFPVAELIAYCSRFFTLSPGDVILSGTPAGCGDFRTPRIALHPGDRIEVEVDGIGTLVNDVIAPAARQHAAHRPQEAMYSR